MNAIDQNAGSKESRFDDAPSPRLKNHRGWAPLIVLPGAVFILVPSVWPRWVLMWTLAIAIFCGCKWLTWRRSSARGVPVWRHLGYLLAWPGLDADAFLNPPPPAVLPKKPTASEWLFGFGKLFFGAGFLFAVPRRVPAEHDYVVGWIGMIGLVMILHFGLFHVLSCWWRRLGVSAKPLMNWPLTSVSVSEFWGRRWNSAFRDLTHRFLFRPLIRRVGPRGAILTGFVVSGLVHELVISIPAGGGYGGPSLFFLVQGAAIFMERGRVGKRLGLGQGWRGRVFTLLVLIVPICALFHSPFVVRIFVPFMRVVSAI